MNPSTADSPVHHTQRIKAQMHQLIGQLREDIGLITEPKAQALFETSAEVLTGLVKAFDHYERKCEDAWKAEPATSHAKEENTHTPPRG
jgi:hypothetical protein